MTDNNQSLDIYVTCKTWPVGWNALVREWGFSLSKRSTDEFPIWSALSGKGYSIWLSELRLKDSVSSTPRWLARMESLSEMTMEGQVVWDDIQSSFVEFLKESNADFTTENSYDALNE